MTTKVKFATVTLKRNLGGWVIETADGILDGYSSTGSQALARAIKLGYQTGYRGMTYNEGGTGPAMEPPLMKLDEKKPVRILPFKFLMVDGRDWVIWDPEKAVKSKTLREAFKRFHGRAPSRTAKVFVVHPSTRFDDCDSRVSESGAFAPVEVK